MEAVLGETGDQHLVDGDDQHQDDVVVGDVVSAHEQGQRIEATATGADFVAAACAFHEHRVLQYSSFLDRQVQNLTRPLPFKPSVLTF